MTAESPVDATSSLDLVLAVVPVTQAVGDRIGVVEGRRQFVLVFAAPGRLSGSVRADDNRQPRAVVASRPLALRAAVDLGHAGYWWCFGLSAGKVSSAPSGHMRVTCPVASSWRSITPPGVSEMMNLSSSLAYTHDFPWAKHISRASSVTGMVIVPSVSPVSVFISLSRPCCLLPENELHITCRRP